MTVFMGQCLQGAFTKVFREAIHKGRFRFAQLIRSEVDIVIRTKDITQDGVTLFVSLLAASGAQLTVRGLSSTLLSPEVPKPYLLAIQ